MFPVSATQAVESGAASFPYDFPDTPAGAREAAAGVAAARHLHARKPPSKRPPMPPVLPSWRELVATAAVHSERVTVLRDGTSAVATSALLPPSVPAARGAHPGRRSLQAALDSGRVQWRCKSTVPVEATSSHALVQVQVCIPSYTRHPSVTILPSVSVVTGELKGLGKSGGTACTYPHHTVTSTSAGT